MNWRDVGLRSSPIEVRDRIASLDIIRGFALFGVFLANMPLFQWPVLKADLYLYSYEYSTMDNWIRMLFDMFIETKFFSIFSFLFGLGFYIFMSRAEEKGLRVYRLFSRRLIILALIGLIHLVFFWYGDILLKYALAGFVLIFFYKRKPKTILIWIMTMMIALIGLIAINFITPAESVEQLIVEQQAAGSGKIEEMIEVYKRADYTQWLAYRLTHEIIPVLKDIPYAIITAFFMFLIGLYAGKRGILQYVSKHLRFIKRSAWITGSIGLPLSIAIMMLYIGVLDYGMLTSIYIQLLTTVSGPFLSLFYISGIVLLLRSDRWIRWLRPLGFAGRMALTNYLTQTLISVGIFTGLGLFGTLNLALGVILCFLIYPLQIAWSSYWLKRYRFGPIEWVWRSLTYGKFQPMKIEK